MKTPENMTKPDLVAYAHDLKWMIHTLQVQLTKSLESTATHRAALRGLWESPESESVRNHVASLLGKFDTTP
jgi:hypothetical protein